MNTYSELREHAKKAGHSRFCTLIALSLLTDTPFDTVHHSVRARGWRGSKKVGMKMSYVLKAFGVFGASYKRIPVPKGVKTNITLKGRLDPNKKYLIEYSNHVAAYINGKIEDWSDDRRLRVRDIFEVSD